MAEIARLFAILPTADHARNASETFGEVILADSCEEMVQIADDLACEHFEVVTADPDLFLRSMTNYGALSWAAAPVSASVQR